MALPDLFEQPQIVQQPLPPRTQRNLAKNAGRPARLDNGLTTMFQWLGELISPVADVGKTYLDGKTKIAKAEIDYKVDKLKEKGKMVKLELDAELAQLASSSTLDQMAMKQAQKSLFDEFLALVLLSPLALVLYGITKGAPPEQWGVLMIETFEALPIWYQVAIGLIFVNYFSFRSLLRVALKAWGQKKGMSFDFGKKKTQYNDDSNGNDNQEPDQDHGTPPR